MESIQGKRTLFIDSAALTEKLVGYSRVLVDLGTGDGRFVRHMASADSTCFVIGLDACRENLREVSRQAQRNTLYCIANALALPVELHGLATHVTINFPWGSLLDGLLTGNGALMGGLIAITRPGALIDV